MFFFMRFFNSLIIVLVLLLFSSTCIAAQDTQQQQIELKNCTKVSLETSMGRIVVALYNDTPIHRDNFIKLVKEGYYDGLLFHRVINEFMIQGGDPTSRDADSTAMLGSGGPGYTLPAEIKFPEHYHKRGALAAARTGDSTNPNRRSSGSQFYIVTGSRIDNQALGMIEMRLESQVCQNIFVNLVEQHRCHFVLPCPVWSPQIVDALIAQVDKEPAFRRHGLHAVAVPPEILKDIHDKVTTRLLFVHKMAGEEIHGLIIQPEDFIKITLPVHLFL